MKLEEAKQVLNENGYILKEAENLRFRDEIENLGFDFHEYGHKGLYQILGKKDGKLREICRYDCFRWPECELWQVEYDEELNGHSINKLTFNGQDPDEVFSAIEYVKDRYNEL